MKNTQRLVRVMARDGIDLSPLSESMGPISAACGTAGPSIARQVLAGNGKAEIPLSLILLATDTQSGVEAIFDNFQLSDPQTAAPLFHALAKESTGK
jgi:hypothetical protein